MSVATMRKERIWEVEQRILGMILGIPERLELVDPNMFDHWKHRDIVAAMKKVKFNAYGRMDVDLVNALCNEIWSAKGEDNENVAHYLEAIHAQWFDANWENYVALLKKFRDITLIRKSAVRPNRFKRRY